MEKVLGGGLLRVVSLLLLLVVLSQTLKLIGIVKGFEGKPPPLLTVSYQPPDLEVVSEGDWIVLTGSAPGFSMAVLLADGKETDVCAITDGHFTFNLRTDGKDRSVQVQVFGNRLPSLFSRSLLLPERTEARGSAPSLKAAGKPSAAPSPVPRQASSAVEKIMGAPPSPFPLSSHEDFSRGNSRLRRVAITFDGGSYSNATDRILDVLGSRGLKATFFLTGEFIKRYPEITRRIVSQDHEVGNHMYSHPHLTSYAKNLRHDTLPGVNRDFVLRELKRNEELFKELTGQEMVPLWRAPFGEQNETIRRWATEAGYRHVSWTYDPKTRKSLDGLDWVSDRASALYLTSNQIVRKILSFDRETDTGLAGGIVLLHLGSERKVDPFYPKLGDLIDQIEQRGYKLGMVSKLLDNPEGG